jgi:lipoprotein-releasing system ATP-binding protein
MKTIAFNQVYKTYKDATKTLEVLKNVTLQFEQGQSYAITGVSGSGKSTLLHLAGGLDQPTSGSVIIDGQDMSTIEPAKKRLFLNQQVGFVFQFHYLIKELSVLENIMLMGFIAGQPTPAVRARALELLERVGLSDKANQYPTKLSGGQQQRASIARALFNRPAFLLADEPTGNLDAANAGAIVDLFLDAQRDWGMGMIICSHDQHVFGRMQHIYSLESGHLTV